MINDTTVTHTQDIARQLQWVSWLQSLGLHLHPCDHPSLPTCAGLHTTTPCDGKRGKHPAGRWTKIATNDPDQLRVLFSQGPRNIGIACGPSRLLVVDEDRPGAFAEFADSLGETIPRTLTVTTAKGRHFYFRQPDGVTLGNATGRLAGRGIDIRGRGGYVIGPGSLHETGVVYTPIDPSAPILPVPAWLIEALQTRPETELPLSTPQGQPIHRSYTSELARALARDTGDRSADFAAVVGACKRAGLTPDETVSLLINAQHPAVEKYGARLAAEVDRFWQKASEGRERLTIGGRPRSREGQPTTKPKLEDLDVAPATLPAPEPEPEPEKEKKAPSQATILVRLARERYRLILGDDNRPYAVAKAGPNIARPLRGSGGLRAQLARLYAETCGGAAPSQSALADALTVLEGYATDAPPEPVYLRVAPYQGGVVLDLGTADGRCVVVDTDGWRIETRPPVLFRRTALTSPLPDPQPGSLDGLRKLINADEPQWRLLVGWLVAALLPDIPHPILALFGEQGTAKSTTTKLLMMLIDPSPGPLRSAPRDVRQWAVTANASWAVAIDNVSDVPAWLSDLLCKAVTGDAHVDRALYTDDDVSVMRFRRVLALNGISVGALRGDLADRLVPIELRRVEPDKRRSETEIMGDFAATAPVALGALLTLLARVLRELPTVELAGLPRMADFARVLAALDRVTGWQTLATYEGTAGGLAESVVDSDPFATAVRDFADKNRGEWLGSPTDLLAAITPEKPPRGWPRTAQAAGGALTRIAPALRLLGYTIERAGRVAGKGRAQWRIAPPPSGQTPDDRERLDSDFTPSHSSHAAGLHTADTRSDLRKHAERQGCEDQEGCEDQSSHAAGLHSSHAAGLHTTDTPSDLRKHSGREECEDRDPNLHLFSGPRDAGRVTGARGTPPGASQAEPAVSKQGCARWLGAEGRYCGATEGLRRYQVGWLCPEHQPQVGAA